MSQSLAKDFNFRSLLKFAFPSIIMMIFMSLYSIVDGFFIAQYVDSMALSAANIVYPAVSILLAVGIMFGTGGSAVVAAKIGQEEQEEANRNFSALTLTTLIIGILGAVLGNLFCRQICSLLGATPVLMDYGTAYLRTILSFAPVCLLQALFQSFFVTAGRPGLGLSLTVSAGITNMLLDYLFVVPSWCCGSGPCHRPWPVYPGRCRYFILYLCPKRPSFHQAGIFQRPALHKLLQRFLRDGQQSFCSRCHLPFQHADAEI
jgi:Na+-driven multidrug efflux pump